VKVMIEEYMENDPDQQKDQGYQSYIEIWFHTITKIVAVLSSSVMFDLFKFKSFGL